MVRSPFPPGSLHTTWLGDELGLWIDHPEATARDIAGAAVGIFGPELRAGLTEHLTRRPLYARDPLPRASLPAEEVDMIIVDIATIAPQLMGRSANPSWSPSIAWMHHATLAAVEVAASGRVLPSIRTAGLRWRADWLPLRDQSTEDVVATIAASSPPVVTAGSDKPVLDQVRSVLDHLVDAICRTTLAEADWRPPLPRTRASTVVALRRVTTALSKPDAVFLGDSVAPRSRIRRMVDAAEHP